MEANEKTCPFCAETIRAAAIVCKHCGRDLREGLDSALPSNVHSAPAACNAPLNETLENHKEKQPPGCLKIGVYVFAAAIIINILRGTFTSPTTVNHSPDKSQTDKLLTQHKTIPKSVQRTDAEKKAIAWAKSMMEQLRKEVNGIKKEDPMQNTIWLDIRGWETINRDLKETMMQGVGVYFMNLNNERIPRGRIRSYDDDSLLCEMDGINNVKIHIDAERRQEEGRNKYADNLIQLKIDIMEHVQKNTAVPWRNYGNFNTLYNVVLDPDCLDSKTDYNFIVSFNFDPQGHMDGEETYISILYSAMDFFKNAGVDLNKDGVAIRVRSFIPGKVLAPNTPSMKYMLAKLGKGHWRTGQQFPAFNAYWWEWTDGE